MSDSLANLRRKIGSATDLQSVVRTMKALAAASIGQYEQSVLALADYDRTGGTRTGRVLSPGGRRDTGIPPRSSAADRGITGIVVFGSDQGLVGQFNDVVAEHALHALAALQGKITVWAVGERVNARLAEAGHHDRRRVQFARSVQAITPLVWEILVASASATG